MQQRLSRRHLAAALFALIGVAISAQDARPAGDRAFFDGKTITYIVATKPGGGYDAYARLIGPYLEKYLPGAQVRVQNMPGAGNLIGLNHLSVAKPDGLTIGTFNTGLLYAQLLQRPGMQVDLRRLDWIGKASSDPRILVVSTQSGIVDLDGLRNRASPALFSTSGVGGASHNETIMLAQALELDIKVVPGFSGGEDELAMLRGEIQGAIGSYSSLRPFVDNGHGRIVLRIGGAGIVDAAVPAASDLVRSDIGSGIVTVMQTLSELGRLTAAPGGVPPARLAALREAYAAALADPELRAKAAKLNIPIDPLPGDEVERRVEAALSQPAAVVERMRALTAGAKR